MSRLALNPTTFLPVSLFLEMFLKISNITSCSVSEHTTFSSSISTTDTIKDFDGSFDPSTIKTKDTVRALATALEACGVIARIEDICIN